MHESYIYVKNISNERRRYCNQWSDGRDDILLLDEKQGEKNLNYDHTLFLEPEEAGDISIYCRFIFSKKERL